MSRVINNRTFYQDPTNQAIEVELVIDELNVLREDIRQIQQQVTKWTTIDNNGNL